MPRSASWTDRAVRRRGLAVVLAAAAPVVLPAVAVGRRGFGIADSWEATRSNGLRLLAASLLIGLGMLIFSLVLGVVADLMRALVGGFADAITVLADVFGTLVFVSSLSLAYGFLVEDRAIER